MPIDPQRAVLLVSGVAALAIAGLILALGLHRGLNRALAALVAARGAATLLPQVSDSAQWAATAVNLQPYFALALGPLAVYCMALLSRDGLSARSGLGWGAVGAILALDLAFFLDHGLLHTIAPGDAATGALRAADGLRFTAFGPLAVVAGAAGPLLAVLGLRLALHYRAAPRGPDGTTLLLLASGLVLGALFDGASRLAALADLLDSGQPFPFTPWGWAVVALPVAALLPAALTLVVLAAGRNVDPRPRHALEGRVLVLAALAFFSGFLRFLLPANSDVAGSPLVLILLGIWRLVAPLFIGYAIVLRTWSGAESRAQDAVAWILLLALMAGSGVVAAMAAGLFLPTPVHAIAGLVAAALMATAGRGLLRGTRAVAHWLLPREGQARTEPRTPAGVVDA